MTGSGCLGPQMSCEPRATRVCTAPHPAPAPPDIRGPHTQVQEGTKSLYSRYEVSYGNILLW